MMWPLNCLRHKTSTRVLLKKWIIAWTPLMSTPYAWHCPTPRESCFWLSWLWLSSVWSVRQLSPPADVGSKDGSTEHQKKSSPNLFTRLQFRPKSYWNKNNCNRAKNRRRQRKKWKILPSENDSEKLWLLHCCLFKGNSTNQHLLSWDRLTKKKWNYVQ